MGCGVAGSLALPWSPIVDVFSWEGTLPPLFLREEAPGASWVGKLAPWVASSSLRQEDLQATVL